MSSFISSTTYTREEPGQSLCQYADILEIANNSPGFENRTISPTNGNITKQTPLGGAKNVEISLMALVAVSSVINSTLVPLLSGEVNLLRNIHREVASIKAELESIMSFLKDVDSSPKSKNEKAKNWVKQVRELAYQIEDVMDEYVLHLAENRQRHGFIRFLRKLTRSITKLKPQHDIATQIQELPEQQLLGTLARNFKLLKVLDLEDAPLDQLGEEVGNLLHLRYLSVKRTRVKIIPKSIGNLHNLQTLNLADSLVEVLQIGILSRLRKLRHLIGRDLMIQGGIGHLEELQTLRSLEANDDLIKELENLRQLRKLGIWNFKRERGKALCTAIEKMKHLQALRVWAIYDNEILDLHSLSSPPEFLRDLFLWGLLETLPNWISRLDNLVSLNLSGSGLTGDHAIKALQAVPNLIELRFCNAYDGEQLYFNVRGFPKLKLLYLEELEGLNSTIIEEGGLPVLKELKIVRCPQLKEVPSGILSLRDLESLVFRLMPTEFLDRMQARKGQDYWIIENIPTVKFLWTGGGLSRFYTPREFQDVRESQRVFMNLKSLGELNNALNNSATIKVTFHLNCYDYRKIDAMALVAVSSAINSTLVPLLSGEVKLLRNIHTEVASIKTELESIRSFLKDADSSTKLENERMKNWVKQVRELAYQIEDIMDEYILHLAENKKRRGFIGFLRKLARSITKLRPQHDIASQIQVIKQTIREIKERAERYGFSSLEHGSTSKTEEKVYDDPRVASLFIEEDEVIPKEQLLATLARNFKLLKVLDLQNAPLDQLHEDVGNLVHLRYLSVNRTKVKIIPISIGNLHNLQTLNLAHSCVDVLQIGILSRLRMLRHLIAPWPVPGLKIQGGIGHLEELQTLHFVEANEDLIKELENLRQLRKLGIKNLKKEHGKALCSAIEMMNHLQYLAVYKAIDGDGILDLHSLSSVPESLQHLNLNGRLGTLPNWISRFDYLVSLVLSGSGLTDAHAIKTLQALPNLMQLYFRDAYDGEQLCFEVGGFQKLKKFYLRNGKELNSVVMEEGGLPVLNELWIGRCPQLKEVPSGIRNLRELKSLFFWDMPTEFLDRMQPDKGPDYWIVEHTPKVLIVFTDGGTLFNQTKAKSIGLLSSFFGRVEEGNQDFILLGNS
ncbi:hypothetical protein RHSIM_Rhsim02G0078400 [Rhododendron simsii]|uniref:Rx N-terminal domain-containing protein n=1 Tax=Rhododendron simsii TaxID=118357 RepID=A0A834H8Q0_RHOSS|nr:hypothetical protein RHSIM_Rhsim02G0078400 [Rhododendron simsii]